MRALRVLRNRGLHRTCVNALAVVGLLALLQCFLAVIPLTREWCCQLVPKRYVPKVPLRDRVLQRGYGAAPALPAAHKLRVLFLTHRYEYTSFMDRSFYYQYEAARRHPDVEAVLWGWGLPEYDNARTLRENLVRRYGSVYFDVIFLFGHVNATEVKAIGDAGEAVVAFREFECFDFHCLRTLLPYGVHVFQLSYMVDMPLYLNYSFRRVVMHSPHCAEPSVFFAPPSLPGRHGALLIGAISEAYPLRQRWKQLIDGGRLPAASQYRHPGYFQMTLEEAVDGGRPWQPSDDAHVAARNRQVADYASAMHQAKVLLFDSSTYKYPLMKFIEGVMAGCLIISDLPNDRPELFAQLVVPVDPGATDEELVDIVCYWLTHDQERIARVRHAQSLIMAEFTWDRSIDRLIDGVHAYRQQAYGMYFSGSFILSCTSVNMIKGKARNAWCPDSARVDFPLAPDAVAVV